MTPREFGAVIIGDELLSGRRRDTHMPFLIDTLGARGLALAWVRFVGDEADLLTGTLRQTRARPAVVFCFGGIGATPDDLTRPCAATAFERPLTRHPEFVAILECKFGDAAYPYRVRMAELPAGATLIPNPVNGIPGFSVGHHHFLPGFPDMAHPMVEWVLDTRYADLRPAEPPVTIRLQVRDCAESRLVPILETVQRAHPAVKLASLPATGERTRVELGLTGPAAAVTAARRALEGALQAEGIAFQPL